MLQGEGRLKRNNSWLFFFCSFSVIGIIFFSLSIFHLFFLSQSAVSRCLCSLTLSLCPRIWCVLSIYQWLCVSVSFYLSWSVALSFLHFFSVFLLYNIVSHLLLSYIFSLSSFLSPHFLLLFVFACSSLLSSPLFSFSGLSFICWLTLVVKKESVPFSLTLWRFSSHLSHTVQNFIT